MKYRTKTNWLALIEKHSQSGLSISEFCRQEGLGRTYFQKKLSDFRASQETLPRQQSLRGLVQMATDN